MGATCSIHPSIPPLAHSHMGEPLAAGVAKDRTRLQGGEAGPGGGLSSEPGSTHLPHLHRPHPSSHSDPLTCWELTGPQPPTHQKGCREGGPSAQCRALWDRNPRPPEMPGFMKAREDPGVDKLRGVGTGQPGDPASHPGALAPNLIHSNCELGALPAFGAVGAPRRPLSPVG